MIKFHNATDSEGNIINIADVKKEHRAKQYYCVGCGKEMSAVLGEKREHHFRHKGDACSWESYLHKLGKRILKERFETQKDFTISYFVEYICNKFQSCKLKAIYNNPKCSGLQLQKVNLKELYDTCEEEVSFKGFRADLMLSHSKHPEREPIFIEVSVTHDCEQEKIDSGIKIIEIKITDEKDLLLPLEEQNSHYLNIKSKNPYTFNILPPIRFYNFPRNIITGRPLTRFWISNDKNGVLHANCTQDNLTCQTVEENHREDSLFEVATPSGVLIGNQRCNPFEFGMIKAFKNGLNIKHCCFCAHHSYCIRTFNIEEVSKTDGVKRIVPHKFRMDQLTDENIDKFVIASQCKNYQKNVYITCQIERYYQRLPYWEWRK